MKKARGYSSAVGHLPNVLQDVGCFQNKKSSVFINLTVLFAHCHQHQTEVLDELVVPAGLGGGGGHGVWPLSAPSSRGGTT